MIKIQSFERVRSQKLQVAGFGKDHFVDCKELVETNDRKAHATSDFLAVSEDES